MTKALQHLYRDFGGDTGEKPADKAAVLSQDSLEDMRLESFENGYSAGWEDAVKAQTSDESEAIRHFMANLQSASFGFHEARAGLVKAMQPVLSDIIGKLLPEMAQETLVVHVVEQLTQMIRTAADQSIRIEATQTNLDLLEKTIPDGIDAPFVCVPNSGLGEHQVILKVGAEEREFDLDAVISGVTEAVHSFLLQIQKDHSA